MLYVNPLAFDTPAAPDAAALDSPARREGALREFERVFLFELLREMRRTVPDEGLFGKSSQRAYFEEMLDDALAGTMTDSGQMGIARAIAAQWDAQAAARLRNEPEMPITAEAQAS